MSRKSAQQSDGGNTSAQGIPTESGSPRDHLVTALRLDLLGPGSADEIIEQSPGTRYLLGMLAPKGTGIDQSQDESTEGDDEGEGGGARSSLALSPSSIGLSFLVAAGRERLLVTASWGEYFKLESEPEVTENEEHGEDASSPGKRPRSRFKRVPFNKSADIDFKDPTHSSTELGPGVVLEWSSSKIGDFQVSTVFLINNRVATGDGRPNDEEWLYQSRIEVSGVEASFVSRTEFNRTPSDDPDIVSADLLYRERPEFAVGHGVAAGWEVNAHQATRATRIWTEHVPESEVFPVTGPSEVAPISMDALATATSHNEISGLLSPMLLAYESWIDDRGKECEALSDRYKPVARDHLMAAKDSLERMRNGLGLLQSEPDALAAFRFANKTMAMQRRASERVLAVRRGDAPPVDASIKAEWHSFQIGFILQAMTGIARPDDPDRNTIDLLWYPTGGGKTEAYLGLTAFTLGLRRIWRLRDGRDYSVGTSVLMRYTLRLLTIQQFQRALTLICACEIVRVSDKGKWGDEPFRIGLWVGQSVTPNSYEDSKAAIEKLKNQERVFDKSPYQLLDCPWCGAIFTPANYLADDEKQRTTIKCFDAKCPFNPRDPELGRDGIPALVVDHEIYRHPPSLLLATVDKFAQMAWNGNIRHLFGNVERRCTRHGFVDIDHAKSHSETRSNPPSVTAPVAVRPAPIDLIIQDELHLISGPMGSLVGLYEGVIDGANAVTKDESPRRPKIVASTATIRRARDQLRALYDRGAEVFPAPGIDADDSFFAKVDRSQSGRLYVGVFGPGKSIKTTLVRTYGMLLTAAQTEFEKSKTKLTDSYMTLVGYFNSVRELGGALRLIEDDVPARINVLRRRGVSKGRFINNHRELTSRRASFEIADTLSNLDTTYLDKARSARPIDVLLASNMLSVGVDINRLSLMVMSAQPKTTAEYIQATSRIGRRYPGLVIQVYNWVRPRDISHYERFVHYHQTFYRHVEATSVTPFSERARDRGLAGALAAYVRQTAPNMSHYRQAGNFDPKQDWVDEIVGEMRRRAVSVTDSEDVGLEMDQQLGNYVDQWARWASKDNEDFVYGVYGPLPKTNRPTSALLKPMDSSTFNGRSGWAAANSMREVEAELDVVILTDDGSGRGRE